MHPTVVSTPATARVIEDVVADAVVMPSWSSDTWRAPLTPTAEDLSIFCEAHAMNLRKLFEDAIFRQIIVTAAEDRADVRWLFSLAVSLLATNVSGVLRVAVRSKLCSVN